MRFILCFLLIAFSFFSCSDKKNKPLLENPKVPTLDTRKANDLPLTQSPSGISANILNNMNGPAGISTSPNIKIQNGNVKANLKNGSFVTGSGYTIKLVINDQINGTLNLKDAVTHAIINGTTVVTSANILFTPDEPLKPSIVYDLVFLENETNFEYKEKIFISGANYCNPTTYFSMVPFKHSPATSGETINLVIKENIYTDALLGSIAIVSWDHISSKSFNFKINNRTPSAKYKIITAYSAYNIPEHECELYYQRDVNSPFPTWVDNNYGSKITKITEEDTSIHDPVTKEFYHFTKTFVVLKVFNSSNVDITSTDSGIISLQQTDSMYGLPRFNVEEESSLLAYLNRGNNNSYSMVLGGLIVGIFAFFLSRRLIKKQEEP